MQKIHQLHLKIESQTYSQRSLLVSNFTLQNITERIRIALFWLNFKGSWFNVCERINRREFYEPNIVEGVRLIDIHFIISPLIPTSMETKRFVHDYSSYISNISQPKHKYKFMELRNEILFRINLKRKVNSLYIL